MMRKILTTIICVFLVTSLFAQKTKKAEKAYNEGDYGRAIEEYTNLYELTEDSQLKGQFKYYIGESYRKTNRADKAEKPLLEAVKNGFISGNTYYALGEVQLKLCKYDEALANFQSYKRSNPSDPLAEIGILSCNYAKVNEHVNPFFDVKPLDRVNSSKNEFGVSYFNDGLILTSNRSVASYDDDDDNKKDDDKNESYTRAGFGQTKVYIATGNNGVFNKPIEIGELNKMKEFANDGIFSYDPYSRQGFFTRFDGRKTQIQFMELKGNKWEKKDKIDIDTKKEPAGHPFVTPDGNRIYFTSTMPGGFGKSDIWYVERSGKGWGNPINAGDKINTPGNEIYPLIAGDYLFFSSDGHVGFGGFDLYATKVNDAGGQKAINIGRPFNTCADDYNIAMRSDLGEGVFISGRNLKKGEDVYYFKGLPFAIIASGIVVDSETGKPVTNVKLELVQQNDNKLVAQVTTDLEGNYSIYAEPEKQYVLKASVAGYAPATKTIITDENRFVLLDNKNGTNLDFKLSANASVISGRVYARQTFMALENQSVSLLANGKVIQTVKTNSDGIYKFGDIHENTAYTIKTSPKGYFSGNKQFNVDRITRNIEFNKTNGYDNDFALEKAELTKEVLIDKIGFPQGKANLLTESFTELDRLAVMFAQNPQCKITITGHTDNKANTKTAQELTQQRADAVKSYLVSRGVSSGQITTKGMGKSKLLVPLARNEAEHERNNRITYTVTNISEVTGQPTTPVITTPKVPVTNNNTGQQPVVTQQPTVVTKPTTAQPATTGGDLWRVQLAALRTVNMDNPVFKRVKSELKLEVKYAFGAGDWYRYYVGGYSTKEEAEKVAQRIRALGERADVKPSSAF